IDVWGKAFLGETIACARCHDHKFDPITTRDYYALYGVIKSSRYQQAMIDDPDHWKPALQELQALLATQQTDANTNNIHDVSDTKSLLKHATTDGPAWQWISQQTTLAMRESKGKKIVLRTVPANTWDSGLLSNKLEGALRTDSFRLNKPYLHLAVAGYGGRVRLVIDGFSIIRDPIYGNLRQIVNNPESHWLTIPVSAWMGHDAYLEFLDGGPADLSMSVDHAPGHEAWLQVQHAYLSDEPKPSIPLDSRPLEETVDEKWLSFVQKKQQVEESIPSPRYALATAEGTGQDQVVFIRGNHRLTGDSVPRGLPELFAGKTAMQVNPQQSGRLELAERLIDPRVNPLLVRVMVNRVWKHHFGHGLVRSVDDFGHMGETPVYQELLDYLCNWFIQEGWSLKKLHRLIVTSEAYQLGSHLHNTEEDPENLCFTYKPLQRLEAEAWRDAMLAIAGVLRAGSRESGVKPYLSPTMQGRGKPSESGPVDGEGYRSIYLSIRRNFLPTWASAFDFPTPFTTIGKRSISNTPAHGLTLMNDPLVLELAHRWAKQIMDAAETNASRIDRMYLQAFCRMPTQKELNELQEFLKASSSTSVLTVWIDIAHALFCSKEFIFIP
ncbi:MAG TPA: DUF1553 domain-containing protein, partial [Gemmatales bacterium]|nr:DUF1553 domain-containing protein [Gemmatales bacterium]